MASRTPLLIRTLLLIITPTLAASANASSFSTNLGLAIIKDAEAIKAPIETIDVSILDDACAPVKALFGASYKEIANSVEPKLETLKLEFTNANTSVMFNLSTAAVELPEYVGYDPNKTLIIYCHGFTSSLNTTTFKNISTALLNTGQVNVLGLDASILLKFWYLHASTYTRYIGEKLGNVLAAMVENKSTTAAHVYLIGHSLGAHICGYTGKTFTNMTGETIARITALDPAGPCFADLIDSLKLNRTDAEFVDVIHSDAGILGEDESLGHLDFWPNGGSEQPDCFSESCSHGRSTLYYLESVTNRTAFPAVRCKSWEYFKKGRTQGDMQYMGYAASENGTAGDYFLQTNYESPFGLGVKGTSFTNNIGVVNNIGDAVDDFFHSS